MFLSYPGAIKEEIAASMVIDNEATSYLLSFVEQFPPFLNFSGD